MTANVVIIRISVMLHNYAMVFRQIVLVFHYCAKTSYHHQEFSTCKFLIENI